MMVSLFSFVVLFSMVCVNSAEAQTKKIEWEGYRWFVRSASKQGPGPNDWDPSNVWIDSKGFLHMKIAKVNGRWTCAEIWTDKDMGFGTYQCQVEGALDKLDPSIVFSMFSYAGPDGVKEIDVEYAKWGKPQNKNTWWTVYPNSPDAAKTSTGFNLKLNGTYTTSRYDWSKQGVHYWLLGGHQSIDSKTNLIQEWNDLQTDLSGGIPQTPMPLHFNLWLFQGKPPTDDRPVEVVIHSFYKG